MKKLFILKIFGKFGQIMKNKDSSNGADPKRKAIKTCLIVIGAVLLITGLILLLIEPIKRLNRKKISNDALNSIEQKIIATEDAAEMTYVVPVTGNEVAGEEYDFIEESEEIPVEDDDDDGYVTLNSIGILSISRMGIRYSVWDEATTVSLRCGLGHYPDSVMPGERGNATILGHNYRDGSMFHKLGNLKVGDAVKFTGTDGRELTFYVVESKIISADDLIDYAVGNITTSRQLTLVTCTYEYGRYGWRRVVICQMPEDEVPEETASTSEITESTTVETTEMTTEETTEIPTEASTEPASEPTEAQNESSETSNTENTP